MGDDAELNERLAQGQLTGSRYNGLMANIPSPANKYAEEPSRDRLGALQQWTSDDAKRFMPASRTWAKLPPGLYEVQHSPNIGHYFQGIPTRTEGLLRLPHTNSERVLAEIQGFWDRRERFEKYDLPHKRGIILWGPPGSGKSCTIQLVMRDVIERGGVGVKFTHPSLFTVGVRILREIQPETPVVALMEDLDAIVQQFQESDILNLLDGAERVEHIVFLASTNYPEMLGARILNRPSRFDRRFKIGHPNEASRLVYLRHLIGAESHIDIERWVADTDGMSLAHLKELFVAVTILENDYEETIATLKSMREKVSSDQDFGGPVGFAGLGAKAGNGRLIPLSGGR